MNNMDINELLKKKHIEEFELSELIYGSIEIREINEKKYIYTHFKNDGIQMTKYVGEYSELLHNLIIKNNNRAKELKKSIKQIDKILKELNYVDEDLTKEVSLNIDFARKHIIDTIYNQAILEGVAVTLSDTQSIIEGGKVNNISSDDVLKIINLKHAWDFILNKSVILSGTNYSLLCTINKFIEEGFYYNAGFLRSTPVKIGGTNWTPSIPFEPDVKEDIEGILNSKKEEINIAIDLLLYVTKKQLFIDGNKRTSVIFANHYLISRGKGLIVIPFDKVDEYKKMLIDYYESDNSNKISKFLESKCYINLK